MSVEIRAFEVTKIDANPWQTRLVADDEHVRRLADDIAAQGLLQIPQARLHPQDKERVQLVFGHNRLAAWKMVRPGQPFPVHVREFTDRQMSDAAAAENAARKDLTPIEVAQAIRKRMQDFSLSQLEAGKPFGYQSQGAVANLLRLLKLPGEIQGYVGEAGLPERFARMLVSVSQVLPKEVVTVAKRVIASEDKEEVFAETMRKVVNEKGRDMWRAPFAKTEVLEAGRLRAEAGAVVVNGDILPRCMGCEYFLVMDGSEYCVRRPCFDVKVKAAGWAAAARIGKKLGVAVASDEELKQWPEIVFNGEYRQRELMDRALALKHDSLRLWPVFGKDNFGWEREQALGSAFLVLGTIDMAALRKVVAQMPKVAKSSLRDEAKRNEARARKQRDECRRLMKAAAPWIAKAFVMSERLLDLMILAMASRHFVESSTQIEARAKKADAAGKALIIAEIVIAQATGAGSVYGGGGPQVVGRKIQELAQELKVRLPAGWQAEKEKEDAKVKKSQS